MSVEPKRDEKLVGIINKMLANNEPDQLIKDVVKKYKRNKWTTEMATLQNEKRKLNSKDQSNNTTDNPSLQTKTNPKVVRSNAQGAITDHVPFDIFKGAIKDGKELIMRNDTKTTDNLNEHYKNSGFVFETNDDGTITVNSPGRDVEPYTFEIPAGGQDDSVWEATYNQMNQYITDTSALDIDDTAINEAILESEKYGPNDEQKVANDAAANSYVDELFEDPDIEEMSLMDKALNVGKAFIDPSMKKTLAEKISSNLTDDVIEKNKEAKKAKKDLILKAQQNLFTSENPGVSVGGYNDNKQYENSPEFDAFIADLDQDDIKAEALKIKTDMLNAESEKYNLTEAIDDQDVGQRILEDVVNVVLDGGVLMDRPWFMEKELDGKGDKQAEMERKAKEAQSVLNAQITKYVNTQSYHLDNMTNVYSEMEKLTDPNNRKKEQHRLKQIENEYKIISKGRYATEDEVDEANVKMQALMMERDEIVALFDGDKAKYDKLRGIFDKHEGMYQDVLKDGKGLISNDKELAAYLNVVSRRHGGVEQMRSALRIGANSLVGGMVDAADAIVFAPLRWAEEKYSNGDLPEGFQPVVQMAKKYEKLQDTYGMGAIADHLSNVNKKLQAGTQEPPKLGDINFTSLEGLENLGSWMGNTTMTQLPNAALMYMTGGASLYLMSASAMGNTMRSMDEEMDMYANLPENHPMKDFKYSFANQYSTAIISGAAEGLSEKVSLGFVDEFFGKLKSGDAIKDGFMNYLKKEYFAIPGLGKNIYQSAMEGGTEALSQITGNLAMRYISGNPEHKNMNIWEGVPESFASGSYMQGVVFKAPILAQSMLGPFQSEASVDNLQANAKEIMDLEKSLNDPNLTPKAREAIEARLREKVQNSTTILKNDIDNIDQMSEPEKARLIEIATQNAKLENQLEAIKQDESLPDETREKMITQITGDISRMKNERNLIVAPYNKARNQKILDKSIQRIRNKARRTFGKGNLDIEDVGRDKAAELFEIFRNQQIARLDNQLDGIRTEFRRGNITEQQYSQQVAEVESKMSEMQNANEQDAKYANGFILENQGEGPDQIVINRDTSLEKGAVNVAAHEFLHKVLQNTVRDNPQVAKLLGQSLMGELAKIDLEGLQKSAYRTRLENYRDQPAEAQAEEVLTTFADAVKRGDLKMDTNKVGDTVRRSLQALGMDVKFKNARDVYNFIGDYQAYAESDMPNYGIERAGKKGIAIEGKLKAELEDLQAEVVKAEKQAEVLKKSIDGSFENSIQDMIENPIYPDPDANAFMIAEMYNPLDTDGRVLPGERLTIGARSILNKLKKFQDLPQFDNKRKAIIDDILNDPATNRSIRSIIKTYVVDNTDGPNGERVPLSGYIGSVLAKRGVSEAVNKHIKSGEGFNSGEGVIDNIGVEDSQFQEEDRLTMLDSVDDDGNPIISVESQQTVLEAMMPIIGVKLPAIDAAKSKNKSVSPLISQLKKEFGVKNGPIHKAILQMIGKTPIEIQEFLNNPKNKEVLLSVLPTSWLAKNIPNAVEKLVIQEDGSKVWTTDHVGRTKGTQPGQIDFWRSTEEGPYMGMTDGKQKIRRNANAIEDVDFNEVFLPGPTVTDIKRGNKTQGKLGLDAMAMALGQELGMEMFDKDLENDGPLTKLFEGRQDLFDRILAENYKSEIIAQMERGTVKMSIDSETPNGNGNVEDRVVELYSQFINQYDKGLSRESNLMNTVSMLDPQALQFMLDSGLFAFLSNISEQMFVKPLKNFMQEFNMTDMLNSYENDTVEQARKKFAKTSLAYIDKLPPSLVKALGKKFFGLTGDKTRGGLGSIKQFNKDGTTTKNYTPEAAEVNAAWEAKVKQKDNTEYDFNVEDVHIYETDNGIIKDINDNILSQHKPGEQGRVDKINQIDKKHGDAIRAANIANPKAMAFVIATGLEIASETKDAKQSDDIIMGVIKLLQGATSNVGGTRGLITYDALEVHGESMATFKKKNKKGETVYTNKATRAQIENGEVELNTEHPYYKEAIKQYPNDAVKAADKMKQKLEHQDVSANVNRENAKSLLTHYDLAKNDTYKEFLPYIKEALKNQVLYNTYQFAGVSNPKINSDIQDNVLTTTSVDGFGRLLLASLAKGVSFMVPTNTFSTNGLGDLISARINESIKITQPTPIKQILENKVRDKAVTTGRSMMSIDSKGITILDFDDTLATSNSLVRYTTPDGDTGTLNAEQYASTYQDLQDQGYVFDFTEFNKVVGGKIAPLFQKALKLQGKFGPDNMFVLTARPPAAQKAIFDFLQANGLNIPVENITGLGNSTSEAKALWVASKVGEGYNDFYFADDALQNVQAVDNVLEQFDVKRKVQQAKVRFSKDADTIFNDILEQSSGIKSEKEFSRAKAKQRGKGKGVWQLFIPASAEDFKGLLYKLLSKGKLGEQQMAWLQENLIDPFARGIRELDGYTRRLTNEYQTLLKANPAIRKALGNTLGNTEFTLDQGIRVYLWNKAGIDIPGLSKTDLKEIVKAIESNPLAVKFANDLNAISKKGYSTPSDYWMTESIKGDLTEMIDDLRKNFLAEWIEKKNIIFSEKNLNKLEAIHGPKYVEALRDMLYRMENGTNRSFGSNRLVNGFANWINNSVGAIMFFNMRSAVLQTLSTVNFINWEENNIMAAAKAFANQKQYWADFLTLWNSDMLVQRRSGLRTGVSQQELSAAVKGAKNPVRAVFQYLLKLGFTPTQIADSFAIASGGATYYRNRIEMYKKQGLDQKEAEDLAFNDFQNIAEETQQSSRPDMISQQQASVLGRFILAFQNTPMQYARLTKKALLDLIAGRGSVKANISKIIYYGAVQNLIFSALQKALFAFMFDDDDEEDKKKQRKKETSLLNSMLDSFLRGTGIGGAIVATTKNMIIKFLEEEKKNFNGDDAKVLIEMLNLSPTVGSKIRKMHTALKTWKFKKDVIRDMDVFDIDNPIWQAIGNVVSSTTNVPMDRAVQKMINLNQALDSQNETWQRIALILGWNTWDLDVKQKDVEDSKERVRLRKQMEKQNKLKKKKEEQRKIKEKERKEKEARSVQCSAKIRKGKGPRCKNLTENKSGKCYAHQ